MIQGELKFSFKAFDAELFFIRRLRDHGRAITQGTTDVTTRKERIRAAIIEGNLDCAIIGKNPSTTKTETYSAFFERLYGEPLTPKRKRHVQTAL